jgi:hypothetical protein
MLCLFCGKDECGCVDEITPDMDEEFFFGKTKKSSGKKCGCCGKDWVEALDKHYNKRFSDWCWSCAHNRLKNENY